MGTSYVGKMSKYRSIVLMTLVLSVTCLCAVDADATQDLLNNLQKIFHDNKDRRIHKRQLPAIKLPIRRPLGGIAIRRPASGTEAPPAPKVVPKIATIPIVRPKKVTFRFGSTANIQSRLRKETSLISYFSAKRKRLRTADLGGTEFVSLSSYQKSSVLRNMPDIDILKIHGTSLQGVKLSEKGAYKWGGINPYVRVSFKGQLLSKTIDAKTMKKLDDDVGFQERVPDGNKTEGIVVWTILCNTERMMQIATKGSSIRECDINVGTNFLFGGDIQVNSTQAKLIESDVVRQIWRGSVTADYMSTKTRISSQTLQPMVRKMIRLQNPVMDAAAELLKRVDISDAKVRTAMRAGDIERILQDPDLRVDILGVVKARMLNPNIQIKLDTTRVKLSSYNPPEVKPIRPLGSAPRIGGAVGGPIGGIKLPTGIRVKRHLDTQKEEDKKEEEEATDEELMAKFKHILEEEKKHGLLPDNVDVNEDDDKYKWDNLNRILVEVSSDQEGDEHGLNRKKRDLAHHIVKRKMKSGGKWGTTIKYKYKSGFSTTQRNAIKAGMNHWESQTCLRFKHGGISWWGLEPHLEYKPTSNTNICGSSPVGKKCCGNTIKLRCWSLGVISHEIGHSIGFWHEQSRPDRDNHVTIYWSNIAMGKSNFYKKSWGSTYTHGVPYDYGSVMHYPSTAFAKPGKKTILPKDTKMEKTLGQRSGLSFWDFKLANLHYCSRACPNVNTLIWSQCYNDGYRDPNHCDRCKCPTGFKGNKCQYYDTNTQICGSTQRTATATPKYIYSPGYNSPGHYSKNQDCVWILNAPSGNRVKAQFYGSFSIQSSSRCSTSHVELRYGDHQLTGPRYCGGSKPGTIFTSLGSKFMVLFHSGSSSGSWKGFKMKYWLSSCGICDNKYSPSPACKTTVVKPCPKKYYTSCGFWGWKRCARYRQGTCSSTKLTCCHGKLIGSYCHVECGGCKNKIVKNQPACRHKVVKTRSKRVKYHVKCGLFGWGRCTRYKYVTETYLSTSGSLYCCSGYTLTGSRCIK